jgi:hypothetical protein
MGIHEMVTLMLDSTKMTDKSADADTPMGIPEEGESPVNCQLKNRLCFYGEPRL